MGTYKAVDSAFIQGGEDAAPEQLVKPHGKVLRVGTTDLPQFSLIPYIKKSN